MPEPTIKGGVVKEYLLLFPNTPDQTLSKKIHRENKPLFESVEKARDLVRYYRGKSGKENNTRLSDRRFIRDETVLSTDNEYDLPESDALEYPIFTIPNAQNEILVLSDIHVPYHSVDALTVALRWGKEHNINTVFINGDFWDFHQLSSFVKDPRKRNTKEELEMGWRVLDTIRNVLPNAVIYFKAGNHEERWEKYLSTQAPVLLDMEEFRLDIILKLGERGISFIGDKIRVKAGKLTILHGHEFKGGGGVNPARWLFLRTKGNAMCSHFHRASKHMSTNINDEILGCWSTGCLCELHPGYSVLNEHVQGFARVRVAKDLTFKVTNLEIHNGQLL